MTDELEALLKEEPEEEEWLVQLLSAGGAGYVPSRKSGVERGTGMKGADGEASTYIRERDSQAEEDVEPIGAEAGASPEEAVLSALQKDTAAVKGMNVRSAAGNENGAETLYRTLLRGRWAADYQRPVGNGRIPLAREAVQTVQSSKDILQMDRAFQRDARRYDGGFTWQ